MQSQLDKMYNTGDDIQSDYNDIVSDFSSTEHGFSIQRLFPKDYKTRMKYSERYNAYDEAQDDLYDDEIEFQQRRKNAINFDRKLTIAEMDELSAEELCAYHQFLQDYQNDRLPNSPTT